MAKYREPEQLDDAQAEQDFQAALVLSAIAEPEPLRILRRLAIRPQCPESIRALEVDMSADEAARHLIDFHEAGMVSDWAKGGWCQLTELGRLAVRVMRMFG